jgi:hypothetical protein
MAGTEQLHEILANERLEYKRLAIEHMRLQGWVRELIDAHLQGDTDLENDALMMIGGLLEEGDYGQ